VITDNSSRRIRGIGWLHDIKIDPITDAGRQRQGRREVQVTADGCAPVGKGSIRGESARRAARAPSGLLPRRLSNDRRLTRRRIAADGGRASRGLTAIRSGVRAGGGGALAQERPD
jgi:hypothetical protein